MGSGQDGVAAAQELFRAGRTRDAFAACRAVLAQDPDDVDALHLSSLIALGAGRHDLAVAMVQQAIALNGHNAFHHNTLGIALAGLGRLVEAADSLSRAVDLAPDQPSLLCNLGLILCRLDRHQEATTVLRQALALDPTSARSPSQAGLAQALYPGAHYRAVLSTLHQQLRPATYVEIGVSTGASLALIGPETQAIGIDPRPCLEGEAPARARIFAITSDEFFARHDVRAELGGRNFDLAFVDGLHSFEQTLTDIAHLERFAGPDSVIAVHDVLPGDPACADRTCRSAIWAGDTWKVVPALGLIRPDLDLCLIPTAPTGLAVIRGLDPERSELLLAALDRLIVQFMPLGFADFQARAPDRQRLLIANQPAAILARLTTGRRGR